MKRTLCTAALAAIGCLASSSTASAQTTLTDSELYIWDVQLDGQIQNGTIDAYDIWPGVCVAPTTLGDTVDCSVAENYSPTTPTTTELTGRQVVTAPVVIGGLEVQRRVFVPLGGRAFARFLDSFTNPTAAPITVRVRLGTRLRGNNNNDLGSDSGTVVVATSSGATAISNADDWAITDDTSATAGDPALAHIWFNGSVFRRMVRDVFGGDASDLTYEMDLTVPAGEMRSIMYVERQLSGRDTLVASFPAADVYTLYTAGLTLEQLASIVNIRPICGDGLSTRGEGCDDGNLASNDGCSATCTVEAGFTCSGIAPTTCAARCGDGVRAGGEACDDGNVASNDGCSATCGIESGYVCTGVPSACATVCGDGVRVGVEACDDGNVASNDGCSATCTTEAGYMCSGAPSSCIAMCGDGVVAVGAEACDDNNATTNDGCTSCVVDNGYSCSGSPSICMTGCGDGIVAGTEVCDDGNTASGDGCDACAVEAGFACGGSPSVCARVDAGVMPDAAVENDAGSVELDGGVPTEDGGAMPIEDGGAMPIEDAGVTPIGDAGSTVRDAAPIARDAAARRDGSAANADGAASPDGGSTGGDGGTGGAAGGGCGCAVPRSGDGSSGGVVLTLLGLALVLRRRR